MANVYLLQPESTPGRTFPGPALAGPEEEQPPSSITGVQTGHTHCTETPSPFEAGIDWVAFTLKGARIQEVQAHVGGELETSQRGFLGYPKSATLTYQGGAKCIMGYGAIDRPGEVHVAMQGAVVRQKSFAEMQRIARWVVDVREGKGTRFDMAFDDRTGALTVERAHQALLDGQCVRRSKRFRRHTPMIERKGGIEPEGDCLYLGTRESATYTRIYDKALERKAHGEPVEGPWTRCEVEWKEERADHMLRMLAMMPEQYFMAYTVQVLRSVVDFRDVTRDTPSWALGYSSALPWWDALTAGLSLCRMVIEKPAVMIQKAAKWFVESVAATMAVLCVHKDFGEEWVRRELVRAGDNLKPRHLLMFQQRLPAMGQV